MLGMRYETVTLLDGAAKCRGLLAQAFAEAGTPNQSVWFNESLYASLDATQSFGLIAWDGESIAGFISVFVLPATHFDGLVASNDVLFVLPPYRNSLLAGRLMALAEREAKRRGAVLFQWAASEGSPLDKALSKRSSYRLFQKVFTKEL